MGFDVLSSVADLAGKVLDRVLPDQAQKAAAIQRLAELQQSGELAQLAADTDLLKGQLEINKVEAASPLTWISGARPAIIWVGALALFVQFVLGPMIAWGGSLFNKTLPIPALNMEGMMMVLVPLLGISTVTRSVDKWKGVASK